MGGACVQEDAVGLWCFVFTWSATVVKQRYGWVGEEELGGRSSRRWASAW
eukprot:CAMPEP_0194026752 /NCGR_PEP_ID=MMETSP0009_2-20130614/1034_1 /TAXON_ID=210454 /ORGANISM="Grammatophora oceanica, Strain CCMP 410" /LENGTH=49 /DNA_ID= /DNA_START= /DNA_END= /DNA_ORIENTATION=